MLLVRDFTNLISSQNLWIGKTILRGCFPLWDSSSQCGIPFAASPFSCLFYPPHWFYAVFSKITATRLNWTLHLMLAAVACYGLARHWRLGIAPSLFAAISFTFCSFCTAWLEFWTGIFCMAWGVLAMLLVSQIIDRTAEDVLCHAESGSSLNLRSIFLRNAALIASLAAVLALQVLASGEIFYYVSLMVAAYGVARWAWHRSWKACGVSLLWILLAGGLALALAMPQLLLTFEMMGFSVRSGEVDPGLHMTSEHPRHWLAMLLPYLYGRPGYPNAYWAPTIYEFVNGTCYVGILPLIGAFFCWLRPKKGTEESAEAGQRRFLVWFFTAVLIGGLILAAGKNTPVYSFLHHWLPGLGHFRFPTKLHFYVVFALPILGALGFQALLDSNSKGGMRNRVRLWWIAAGCFGVLLLGYLLALENGDFLRWLMAFPGKPSIEQVNAVFWDYTWAVLFTLLGLALFGMLAFRYGRVKWVQAGIVAVAFINLLAISRQAQPTGPESVYNKRPELLLKRVGQDPMYRYLSIYWNANQYFYGDNRPEIWEWAVDAAVTSHLQMEGAGSLAPNGLPLSRYNQFFGALTSIPGPVGEKLADMLSLRYIIGGAPFDQILWGNAPRNVLVSERPNSLPRAFVVSRWQSVAGDQQVLKTIATEAFDPHKEAIVEPLAGAPIPDAIPPGTSMAPAGDVRSFVDHGNSVTMEVTAKSRALLVLGDTFYLGWSATVDGVKSPIFQTNYLFRGVFLEPGTHRVEFTFWPTHLTAGLCCFALAAAGCIALVVASRFSSRGSATVPQG